jgi:hypothetical protein
MFLLNCAEYHNPQKHFEQTAREPEPKYGPEQSEGEERDVNNTGK